MPPVRKSTTRTRERLLRAAEHCFTEHGYDGTSLRQITRLARVNLAAVNYHFSSKRELWLEMMHARLAPINAERVRLIEAIRARTPLGQQLSIEEVCQAIFLPIAKTFDGQAGSSVAVARLAGQTFNVPQSLMRELNRRSLNQFLRVFRDAIRDALGPHSAAEVDWRFNLMMASMLGTLAWDKRQAGLEHPMNTGNLELLMRRLSAFVAGGLRAALPAKGKA